MNKENFERLVVDTGIPLAPGEVATDENLSLASLDNQLRAGADERDPYAMTADKLARKIPGMAHGKPYVAVAVAACGVETRMEYEFDMPYDLWREDDEDLLRAEQAAYQEANPMRQEIEQHHRLDEDGNPAGGTSHGLGFAIHWQDGPLVKSEGGTRLAPNGAFVEGVIEAAKGRLEHYQSTKFACPENESAIIHLDLALAALEARTADREERGVEGTHEV